MFNYYSSYSNVFENTSGVGTVISIILGLVAIVSIWKLFEKANLPGWAAIIPIYNVYNYFKMSMGSGWFILLTIIPIVGPVMYIISCIMLAKSFGRGILAGILVCVVPFIMLPIIAFSDDQYVGGYR